jgi:hypothetical protein
VRSARIRIRPGGARDELISGRPERAPGRGGPPRRTELSTAGRAHDIVRRNIRLKSSSIIRIIPAPAKASSLSGDSFTGVAFTL